MKLGSRAAFRDWNKRGSVVSGVRLRVGKRLIFVAAVPCAARPAMAKFPTPAVKEFRCGRFGAFPLVALTIDALSIIKSLPRY